MTADTQAEAVARFLRGLPDVAAVEVAQLYGLDNHAGFRVRREDGHTVQVRRSDHFVEKIAPDAVQETLGRYRLADALPIGRKITVTSMWLDPPIVPCSGCGQYMSVDPFTPEGKRCLSCDPRRA